MRLYCSILVLPQGPVKKSEAMNC